MEEWRIVLTMLNMCLGVICFEYCDPKWRLCDNPMEHTMCLYPETGASARCDPQLHTRLSVAEKAIIVDGMNKLRSKVASGAEMRGSPGPQPAAADMRVLSWDWELEQIAVRWADQCLPVDISPSQHDKCRNVKRFKVGQNIFTRGFEGIAIEGNAEDGIYNWYEQVRNFNSSLVDSHSPHLSNSIHPTGYYSLMIWAKSRFVGCGRAFFVENLPDPNERTHMMTWTFDRLICNIGPAGNFRGRAAYKRGPPCSECPQGTRCSLRYAGLCETIRPIYDPSNEITSGELLTEHPIVAAEVPKEMEEKNQSTRNKEQEKQVINTKIKKEEKQKENVKNTEKENIRKQGGNRNLEEENPKVKIRNKEKKKQMENTKNEDEVKYVLQPTRTRSGTQISREMVSKLTSASVGTWTIEQELPSKTTRDTSRRWLGSLRADQLPPIRTWSKTLTKLLLNSTVLLRRGRVLNGVCRCPVETGSLKDVQAAWSQGAECYCLRIIGRRSGARMSRPANFLLLSAYLLCSYLVNLFFL